MWHITSAEVFTDDNNMQPACVIYRQESGFYRVEIQPNRTIPISTIQPNSDGLFDTFEDALKFARGE